MGEWVEDDYERYQEDEYARRARPMAYADKSDAEVAGRVRMLMRDQLYHEAVYVAARDRILWDAAVANAYEVGKRDGASAQRERDAGIADRFTHYEMSRITARKIAAAIRSGGSSDDR